LNPDQEVGGGLGPADRTVDAPLKRAFEKSDTEVNAWINHARS